MPRPGVPPLLPGLGRRGMANYWVTKNRDAGHRRAMRLARTGLSLPRRGRHDDPVGAVWAVAMVRDEADIIEATVRHLLDQGVDRVLVADNGSRDETPAIIERLGADGRVLLGRDREVGYFQAAKMTLLARYAAAHGAGWVVPFDADELWFSTHGSLADGLRAAGEAGAAVGRADVHNVFPGPGTGEWQVDLRRHALRKVAFRPHRLALLQTGNHWVSRAGAIDPSLRIAHVPWRSEEQLRRKLRQGAQAIALLPSGPHVGRHWRESAALDEAQLGELWDAVQHARPDPRLGWSPSGGPTALGDPFAWSRWPDGVDWIDEA